MALHPDIFWVGKQWAVTGYGMQAVDQKQKSKFDIEAARLWDDDLLEALSDQRWFNADDFNAGLTVARAKYPETPAKAAARKKARESARVPVAPAKADSKAEPAKPDSSNKAAKAQPLVEPAKPLSGTVAPKPEAVPQAPRLAIAPGPAQPAITLKSRPKKMRPAAQLSMRVGGWPAKFTQIWRIRIGQR